MLLPGLHPQGFDLIGVEGSISYGFQCAVRAALLRVKSLLTPVRCKFSVSLSVLNREWEVGSTPGTEL